MRILHQIIPMFFLIQFLVVLAGLVAAMLSTSPEVSLPSSRVAHRLLKPRRRAARSCRR